MRVATASFSFPDIYPPIRTQSGPSFDLGDVQAGASAVDIMVTLASKAYRTGVALLSPTVSSTRFDAVKAANPYGHSVGRSQQLVELSRHISAFGNSQYLEGVEAKETFAAASEDSLVFLSLLPTSMPLPWASHNDDGEVFLKWRAGSKEAEAMFSGNGEVSYALRHGDAFVGGEEEALPTRVPGDLAAYFRA
ncbi:hypothetical protein [Achromobacter spanius]|uniref:hypothetical protein n=1 Tax=Achromobacter spanius TaxID=217203 RepID=UPI003A8FC32B